MASRNETLSNIIFLAHGSPDPRSAVSIKRFADLISDRLGIATHSAYLDHNAPMLQEVAVEIQDPNALVVPMLLSSAFHALFDLPKAAKISGFRNVLPPIGHPIEVLKTLFVAAGKSVMVVAAGTSSAQAQLLFEDAVHSVSKATGFEADHSYVTGKKDLIAPKFSDFARAGGGTVIPWLLAEGKLMDQILHEAASQNLAVEGNGLCQEEVFIEHMIRVISQYALMA